jgi:hypothetical protein
MMISWMNNKIIDNLENIVKNLINKVKANIFNKTNIIKKIINICSI